MGNFNEVFYPNERERLCNFDIEGAGLFNNLIVDNEMSKMENTCGFFTWTNCNRRDNLEHLRLDQTLVNDAWM